MSRFFLFRSPYSTQDSAIETVLGVWRRLEAFARGTIENSTSDGPDFLVLVFFHGGRGRTERGTGQTQVF